MDPIRILLNYSKLNRVMMIKPISCGYGLFWQSLEVFWLFYLPYGEFNNTNKREVLQPIMIKNL